MAFKKFFHNNTSGSGTTPDIAAALEDAIAYAGFTDLSVRLDGSAGDYQRTITVFQGETANAENTLMTFTVGGDPVLAVYMNNGVSNRKIFGLYLSVIATKHAVALLGCMTDGTSNGGVIITKDTAGDYVQITNAAASIPGQTLNAPQILPHGSLLAEIPTLQVSSDYTFGVTTLANFPTVNDGSEVRYLRDVLIALTGQMRTDGDCTIDGTPYYCIGGVWYLKDSEGAKT